MFITLHNFVTTGTQCHPKETLAVFGRQPAVYLTELSFENPLYVCFITVLHSAYYKLQRCLFPLFTCTFVTYGITYQSINKSINHN